MSPSTEKMGCFRILLVLAIILPLALSYCNRRNAELYFKRSVYGFSLELLSRISQDTNAHFVSSTISLWTVLTSISLGARGNTLAELRRVLKLRSKSCFNEKYLELVKKVTASAPQVTLERSSSLFVDNTSEVREDYKRKLTGTGVVSVESIDFSDFTAAATIINERIKQATHSIIEEIVTPNELEGVHCILTDALYFKGMWRTVFNSEDTERSIFFDSHNNAIGEVNLMLVSGEFNVTSIRQIRASVLELSYGDTDRFSMLLFLPDADVSIYDVLGSLQKTSLLSVFSLFKLEGTKTTLVQIPRFKISSDLNNLKELLGDMGLHDTFDSSRASFPDIASQIYVSNFIQKADIEVTEEGTVAASATELGFEGRSLVETESFVANKPFVFMVVDRQTEVPIISGVYSKPSTN